MTGSSHPDIDAVVAAWNATATEEVPNPRTRVIAQLHGDPALVQRIRAEIARLEDTSGPRSLLDPIRPDHVSVMHHRWYSEILAGLAS